MRNFRGTFINKIDAKGRVSVPASFRAVFAENKDNIVCCCQSLSHRAIDAYPQSRLDELTDLIEELDPLSPEYHELNMALNGGSYELTIDSDGRIILPERLLHHARITEQASFVGLGRYFQIWEPASFEATFAAAHEVAQRHPGLLRRRNGSAEPAR
jgi:MraZ protein